MTIITTTVQEQAQDVLDGCTRARSAYLDALRGLPTNALKRSYQVLLREGQATNPDALYGTRDALEQALADVNAPIPELALTPTSAEASDDDNFIRTAIHLTTGQYATQTCGASIDVLLPNGQKLCRLNISANLTGWGSIDVILTDQQTPTLLSMSNGREVVRQELPAGALVAVNIDKKG